MRILQATNYRRMRWKNGGGESAEVIVSPEGSDFDDFDWRVSMAQVASDGPFSLFSNTDRTLAILKGSGLRLRIGAVETVTLTESSDPFSFAADVTAYSELINGPILDLNVMSRRGVVHHKMKRMGIRRPHPIRTGGHNTLLLVQGGEAVLEVEDARAILSDHDSVLLSGAEPEAKLVPKCALILYTIEIIPIVPAYQHA